MTAFNVDKQVRFSHVDAAGIVFYPRYFELINEVVEDWFGRELGLPFAAMHLSAPPEGPLGLPLAEIQIRFRQPSRLGETLTFALGVTKLRRAAIEASLEVRCSEEIRLEGNLTLVYARKDKETWRAHPIPEALAEQIRRFAVTPKGGEAAA